MANMYINRLVQLGRKFSWKLFAKILASIFVLYLLISYFAVNPIAKRLLPKIAESSLNSNANVGSVAFDPFRFKTTINDFKLANKNGEALASFKELIVDLELSGIFDLAWKFKEISISEPHGSLLIASNGQLNWDALITKLKENPSPPSDTIPRLMIEHIAVKMGQLDYVDANRPAPINMTLMPLNFELKGFSTLPKDRGDYLISAAFAENGGSLRWKGDMGVNPVASKGVVAIEGVQIAQLLQLVKGLALPVKFNSGGIKTSFSYDFSLHETIPKITLKNIGLNLHEVKAELAEGEMLSLTDAKLISPQLDFVKSEQPTLSVENVQLKLSGFNLNQQDVMQVALKESTVQLPRLNFSMQEVPQLSFAGMQVQFFDFGLTKGNKFKLALPKAEVLDVSFNLAESNVGIQEIALSGVSFGESSEEKQIAGSPLATLNQIVVADTGVALQDKKVNVKSVLFSDLQTAVIRNADNSINWVKIFETSDSVTKPEVVEGASENVENDDETAWEVTLAKVALNNADIHIEDNAVSAPVKLDVEKASLEVADVTLDMAKALPINVAFNVKQGGQFSAEGHLWPSPVKADLALRLSNLSLKPFAPYVNQVALLKLHSGATDVSGQLLVTQKQDFALTFNGKFDVKQLALLEEGSNAPFLSWDGLSSDSLKVSLMPNKLQMATLKLVKPSGKFIINEDKSTNINHILRNANKEVVKPTAITSNDKATQLSTTDDSSLIQAKPTQSTKSETPLTVPIKKPSEPVGEDAFPVSIDTVRVSNAKLEFADLSLTPQFGTNIHSLTGVINGLSTSKSKVSQVEMDGKVDDYGSARIRGALQPFDPTEFTDVKLNFTNLEMSRLTPYSGKFAGRHIDSGKLSVDLEYKIKQQQLASENKFVINKLKLGEKVESPDAADLPLDLAIAILEDSDGVIDLDLPMTGSLDDPKFSYGGIFWKAFRNVLTKIVTAPFRALGKIFGGGAEDFDGIAFEVGDSNIAPPELEKLAKVSEALTKRQGLALGIVPSFNNQLDSAAIKEAIYRKQVAEEMGIELEDGQKPGPVDLTNENAQEALETLNNELTNKGLFKRMLSNFEEPEDGHYEKIQKNLIASIDVSEADLKKLAENRGKAISEALVASGISQNRLTTMNPTDVAAKGEVVKSALKLEVHKSKIDVNKPVLVEPEVEGQSKTGPSS